MSLQEIVDSTTTYYDLYTYLITHTPKEDFNLTMRQARILFINKPQSNPTPVTIFNKE